MLRHSIHTPRELYCQAMGWLGLSLALTLVALPAGCGKHDDDGLLPVSGQVRLDGKPLAGASVTFRSDSVQIPGMTDSDGRYELKPGAAPGEYRVVIGKLEGSPQQMLAVDPGALGRVQPSATPVRPPRQIIPARYSHPMQTELRFTVVSPGTKQANFELKNK